MCTEIVPGQLLLSRANGGPNDSFSMEPHEFKQMVDDIRIVEKALGRVCFEVTEKQKESAVFRRSLFVVKVIQWAKLLPMKIYVAYARDMVYIRVIWMLLSVSVQKKDIAEGMPLDLEGIV